MIAGNHHAEKHFIGPRRRYVMRRLHEHIARVGERQQSTRFESRDEIRHEMDIGACHQLQGDALAIELGLESRHGLTNLRTGIVVDAGHDMRRAREHLDPAGRRLTRHGDGHREVGRAVVYAGKNMAMKIIHREWVRTRQPTKLYEDFTDKRNIPDY